MFSFKNKTRQRQASILVEALLSVAILAVSLTALIGSLLSTVRGLSWGTDYALAILALEDKMFDALRNGINGNLELNEDFFLEDSETLDYNWEKSVVSSSHLDANIEEIKISLSWQTQGRDRGLSISTYQLNEQ